jgi:hypothetical protein
MAAKLIIGFLILAAIGAVVAERRYGCCEYGCDTQETA